MIKMSTASSVYVALCGGILFYFSSLAFFGSGTPGLSQSKQVQARKEGRKTGRHAPETGRCSCWHRRQSSVQSTRQTSVPSWRPGHCLPAASSNPAAPSRQTDDDPAIKIHPPAHKTFPTGPQTRASCGTVDSERNPLESNSVPISPA